MLKTSANSIISIPFACIPYVIFIYDVQKISAFGNNYLKM